MDISFANNWTYLFFINTTPGASVKTWKRVGAGINNVDPNGNEVISQDPYYDGEGGSNSEVTGGQNIVAFAGHRKVGDPAQDYIAGLRYQYGEARKTDYMQIEPDGTIVEANVTIANIKTHGGDPNAKGDFSFETHFDGAPSLTPGEAKEFPTEITCEPITISNATPVSANPTITPEDASPSVVYAIEDDSIATVDALGNITPIKDGETKLNIKSAVLPTVQCTVEVTVSNVSQQSVMAAKRVSGSSK